MFASPSVLCLLLVVVGQFLDPDEVRANRGALRETLSDIHALQGERAQTPYNTLNTTMSDLMLHRTPLAERDNSFVSKRPENPLLYLNLTNPSPLTIPVRDLVDIFVFGANKTVPTMMPGQESALPLPKNPRRPMSTYCQYQDCTTAGEISRQIGTRLLRLYEKSPVGVMQNAMSAATTAAHFGATRGLTPNQRRAAGNGPVMQQAEQIVNQVIRPATQPEVNRSLAMAGEKVARVALWNNLELVDAPTDRRRATLISLAKARNAYWCRMSQGRLPFCQSEDLLARWAAEAEEESLKEGSSVDASFTNKTDGRGVEFVGYSVNGTAKSCALQGGCLLHNGVKPQQFDRNYFHVQRDARREMIFVTDNLNRTDTTNTFYLRTDHAQNVTERIKWWNTNLNVHFKALITPQSSNLTEVLSKNLPFIFLTSTSSLTEDAVDDESLAISNATNWGRPWLDWRLAQKADHQGLCVGAFDVDHSMCIVPLALTVKPLYSAADG